jgi:hypothetical protein
MNDLSQGPASRIENFDDAPVTAEPRGNAPSTLTILDEWQLAMVGGGDGAPCW